MSQETLKAEAPEAKAHAASVASTEDASAQPTEQQSRDLAEASREARWVDPSFTSELFMGRFRLDLIHPYPRPSAEETAREEEFLARLRTFVENEIDADKIDREGKMDPAVIKGLAKLGAFGMKIDRKYGGLGLSQTAYCHAISLVGSKCGSTAAWLSAHQSIGVPQPLKLFGTEEQKQKYLPRLAQGAVSAFALTEPGVGSDPARMATTAIPTEDGEAYLLNGEKVWCTNGPDADLLVVMARTPSKIVNGKERRQITAFIVEADSPGIETVHRCQFMGLRGISNGLIRFTNVRVPRENVILKEGRGLKIALVTLNAGRLTLPGGSVGAVKACVEVVRNWANERVQWGAPIGHHEAVGFTIGQMAATAFTMEAMVEIISGMVDRHSHDIRLEAALAKMYHSEATLRIAHETLQIRGGRGFETADSLRARGETPIPIERMTRDVRVNTILEGSSRIMRLFIAREAVDPHLKVAGALADPRSSIGEKIAAVFKSAAFYATWYPKLWFGWGWWPRYKEFGPLAGHLRFVDRTARKLARSLFHLMIWHGPKLEKRQMALGRIVEISAELVAMAMSCVYAHEKVQANPSDRTPLELADLYGKMARRNIQDRFKMLFSNEDAASYKVARKLLDGDYTWLEEGIVHWYPEEGETAEAPAQEESQAA